MFFKPTKRLGTWIAAGVAALVSGVLYGGLNGFPHVEPEGFRIRQFQLLGAQAHDGGVEFLGVIDVLSGGLNVEMFDADLSEALGGIHFDDHGSGRVEIF